MPLISLLFIAAGLILFILDALLVPPRRLMSWGLACTTVGFALIYLLDEVDTVTF